MIKQKKERKKANARYMVVLVYTQQYHMEYTVCKKNCTFFASSYSQLFQTACNYRVRDMEKVIPYNILYILVKNVINFNFKNQKLNYFNFKNQKLNYFLIK